MPGLIVFAEALALVPMNRGYLLDRQAIDQCRAPFPPLPLHHPYLSHGKPMLFLLVLIGSDAGSSFVSIDQGRVLLFAIRVHMLPDQPERDQSERVGSDGFLGQDHTLSSSSVLTIPGGTG